MLQAVVSWTAEDGSSVHRVVTRRLAVAAARPAMLRGMDCEVAALLLAKRVVQEARQADAASNAQEAEKLRRAIGEPPPTPSMLRLAPHSSPLGLCLYCFLAAHRACCKPGGASSLTRQHRVHPFHPIFPTIFCGCPKQPNENG